MFSLLRKIIASNLIILAIFSCNIYALNTDNITDYANYLTSNEIDFLQNRIEELQEKYNIDSAIVITNNTGTLSTKEYADSFYNENNLGLDDKKSGSILVINLTDSEIWLSTNGTTSNVINKTNSTKLLNKITSYVSKGKYYRALNYYLNRVDAFYDLYSNIDDPLYKIKYTLTKPITYIASIFFALASIGGFLIYNKNAQQKKPSKDFNKYKSFRLMYKDNKKLY